MHTVIVLGAGASREAGAPLMHDFLDRADEILRDRPDLRGRADFKLVLDLVSSLRSVHAKAYLDLDNIEELLGAVEMGALIDRIGPYAGGEAQRVRAAVVTLIVQTLEYSVRFPSDGRFARPPKGYEWLGQRVRKTWERGGSGGTFAFLTFNYDILLEHCLLYAKVPIDFALSTNALANAVPVLKLHGSVAWGQCGVCREVVPLDFMAQPYDQWKSATHVFAEPSRHVRAATHCGQTLDGTPLIVPPSWNKGAAQTGLARVWKRAGAELAAADNIVVMGYSLPSTDSFFRYLFALGLDADTRLKNLWVVNPDADRAVERRFREFIGRGIEKRLRFLNDETGEFVRALNTLDPVLPRT